MVKQLEKEVADVELPAGRDCGVLGLKFFGKVDFERQGNLVVVCSLLIIAAAEAPNHPFKEFPALVQQGGVLGIADMGRRSGRIEGQAPLAQEHEKFFEKLAVFVIERFKRIVKYTYFF